MIKQMQPLTLNEAKELIKEYGGKEEVISHINRFSKLKKKSAEDLKKELVALENHKIREEQIIKIVDFLPEDASDINKIFVDVSLDEHEIKQITDIVSKYK
ncbi:MAG: hypothetical protein WC533_04000 [Candidatus Pacearchaeota archaeon]